MLLTACQKRGSRAIAVEVAEADPRARREAQERQVILERDDVAEQRHVVEDQEVEDARRGTSASMTQSRRAGSRTERCQFATYSKHIMGIRGDSW